MSQLSVCSATEISRDHMDVETEASPPLHDHDHPYSAPQQVVEVYDDSNLSGEIPAQPGGGQSPEHAAPIPTATRDPAAHYPVTEIKPDYEELRHVKLEPEVVNLSSGPYPLEPQHQQHQQQQHHYSAHALDMLPMGHPPLDNSLILGLILQIPVQEVPYSVTHDDLFKALSVSDDKIAVRTMRKVIPCLRITTYIPEADYTGKKKIKGLWTTRPRDWPERTPYKDPNNGEKIDGRLVPKANSEELKLMFSFLKRKFMQNIQERLNGLTSEEVEGLKHAAAKQSQQYDFSQQPATPKSSSPSYSQLSRLGPQEPVVVKHEIKPHITHPPAEGNQIPTFVSELFNSSPEAEPEQPQEQLQQQQEEEAQVYYVPPGENGDLSPGQYVQYTDDRGNTVLVRVDSTSSSSDEGSPAHEVPETTIETLPQDVRATKRSAPVVAEGEGLSSVVVSGKRVCEEQPTTSRGPIQQVSSPSADLTADQASMLAPVTPKATIEVAPQQRSNPATPAPQTPQQRPSVPMSPFSGGGVGSGGVMYSPVSPMPPPHTPQYRSDLRGSLIHDLHTRIREKINYVQNLTLGDVELSIKLNTMYQLVLWKHYERAQKNEPNNFINAVHACEAMVERAIIEGNNFSRSSFKDDCNTIIAKYSGDENMSQGLVLHVAEPEQSPAQMEVMARLQTGNKQAPPPSLPSPLNPKSPATYLSKHLDGLQLDRSPQALTTHSMDATQLGIRAKLQPDEMQQHLQNLVQHRPQQPPSEGNTLVMKMPEKLLNMGYEVEKDKIQDEDLRRIVSKLDELKKLTGEANVDDKQGKVQPTIVQDYPEVITIDDDSDCELFDDKTSQQPPSAFEAVGQTEPMFGMPTRPQSMVTFNNQAPAPASWTHREREMERALKSNYDLAVGTDTGESMDTDEMLDDVIGLEETYDRFDVVWNDKQKSSKLPQSNQSVQPSTPDEGRFYVNTPQTTNHPPPPYPGFDMATGDIYQGSEIDQIIQIFAGAPSLGELDHLTYTESCEVAPAPQLAIPEVVENYADDMDCESEPKPGTRGRKRGSKGKPRN